MRKFLIIFVLLMTGCAPFLEKVPISPPTGLPEGYQTWYKTCSDDWKYLIPFEQKLDPKFWRQNLMETIPPVWWYNQVLKTNIPDDYRLEEDLAYSRWDFELANKLRFQYVMSQGVTAEQSARVEEAWDNRNSYHNLSYFALGVRDKKSCTFISNPNPDDPDSPFSKEGENIMVTEVYDDNVSGVMELSDWDIVKIGLFEKGFIYFGGNDYIRELVERAQKAKFFLGATRREGDWESYSGYKPAGIFGIASRKRQPI